LQRLQLFPGFESNRFAGRDRHLGSSARVATDAGLARPHVEDSKSSKLNAFAATESALHTFENGFNGHLRLSLGDARLVNDLIDDVEFDQSRLPVDWKLPAPSYRFKPDGKIRVIALSSRPVPNRLFVYGSLRRGCDNPHAQQLDREARYFGSGKVYGRMYRVDWYPGVVLGGSDWVTGDLFDDVPESTIAQLDQYEGSNEFQRRQVEAYLPNGEGLDCWIYEFVAPVEGLARIESGDYYRG